MVLHDDRSCFADHEVDKDLQHLIFSKMFL